MVNGKRIEVERIVPQLPPKGRQLRLIVDTDFATEIDDLYAVALVLAAPDRFRIEGLIGSHFNNFDALSGPVSIDRSCELLRQFLEIAGIPGRYPIKRGAHPMQYYGHPSAAEGVDFIVERAHASDPDDPLWVVCLGASTNLASAILTDRSIIPRVRFVFHARSEHTWPKRNVQYNVQGDVHAARTLLREWVPLVWFETGTYLCCDFALTEKHLASTGALGSFIHEYRKRDPYWMTLQKGFYDMADIAWMIEPEICGSEIVRAPALSPSMFYNHIDSNGRMLRVFAIDNEAAWNMLFSRLQYYSNRIREGGK